MKHQPKKIRYCKICGKEFIVYAYILRKKACNYCSTKCALIARRKQKTKIKCVQCGKFIELSPWELKRASKIGHFCSHTCYGKWRTDNLAGDNSPNWKGGYSMDYGGRHWKAQRRKTLERDNFTCQKCGRKKENKRQFDVHHIIPYDMCDNPKSANQLINLITLCRKCHDKEHNKDGKK